VAKDKPSRPKGHSKENDVLEEDSLPSPNKRTKKDVDIADRVCFSSS
jgi:hypothetical protein